MTVWCGPIIGIIRFADTALLLRSIIGAAFLHFSGFLSTHKLVQIKCCVDAAYLLFSLGTRSNLVPTFKFPCWQMAPEPSIDNTDSQLPQWNLLRCGLLPFIPGSNNDANPLCTMQMIAAVLISREKMVICEFFDLRCHFVKRFPEKQRINCRPNPLFTLKFPNINFVYN